MNKQAKEAKRGLFFCSQVAFRQKSIINLKNNAVRQRGKKKQKIISRSRRNQHRSDNTAEWGRADYGGLTFDKRTNELKGLVGVMEGYCY